MCAEDRLALQKACEELAEQRAHSERELADLRARFESELAKQSAVLRASLQQNFSKAMELFQEGRERGHQKVSGWFDFDADNNVARV